MKKTLLLLLALIGWANQANAQMYYGSGYLCLDCYPNIEVGANYPMISGMDNAKPKLGFNVGLFNYKEINEKIYIKFGPSFSQFKTGFDAEGVDDLTINTFSGNIAVHYLEQRNYQFFGGFSLEGNLAKDWIYFHNDAPEIKFLTYSIYAGGGLIFAERIELSVKYNLGLTNITSNSDYNWKRNYLSLNLGYTFL